MKKQIIMPEPRIYYGHIDEALFFKWLKSVKAIKGVVGTRKGLKLDIKLPIDSESLSQLLQICSRYQLDFTFMRHFIHQTNPDWFDDKDAYWYKPVFGKKLKKPRRKNSNRKK